MRNFLRKAGAKPERNAVMKIALIQMAVSGSEEENLRRAREEILRAAEAGTRLAVLPEMFLCPYDSACFPRCAEERGGHAWQVLGDTAKEAGLTLAAGSLPERDGEKLYNTCFVFGPDGREITRHRKLHLFDVDIRGGQRFRESDTLSPGESPTFFEADGHRFGLCICFDVRFPELFRLSALRGAEAMVVPAAFNRTTGPMHWELLFRARAADNQLFTIGCAPARDETAGYVSYANSIVCSPWGQVIARAGTGEELLTADLDFALIGQVREQLPLLKARRPELYG